MIHDVMWHRFAKALHIGGDLFSPDDIFERINDHRMQSFVRNNTWVVTQVSVYPRRKVLDIVLLVGELEDAKAMEPEIVKFARDIDATLIQAYGRFGWDKFAAANGWRVASQVYHKDIAA